MGKIWKIVNYLLYLNDMKKTLNKSLLQSIIGKYYLDELFKSVRWITKNNTLTVAFSNAECRGDVVCGDFPFEDSKIGILDTEKFRRLLSITSGDLLLELEKIQAVYTKMQINDSNYKLNFVLSDIMQIPKAEEKTGPSEWEIKYTLTQEDINYILKATSAAGDIDTIMVRTSVNLDEKDTVEFIFGGNDDFDNKITYAVESNNEIQLEMPYSAKLLKSILSANKDAEFGTISWSKYGMMRLQFKCGNSIESDYIVMRQADL